MTTNDDQKPKDTTEADSEAGVSCAAPAGSVPNLETVEGMAKWFDGQPAGQYDMLFSSEGAEITTPAPFYETLSSIKDKRCGVVVWDKLTRVCASALNAKNQAREPSAPNTTTAP